MVLLTACDGDFRPGGGGSKLIAKKARFGEVKMREGQLIDLHSFNPFDNIKCK